MKKFSDFLESKLPASDLAKNVNISDRAAMGEFSKEGLGNLEQKTAKHEQIIFPADNDDDKEFGKGLGKGYVLVRVSTPLSKPGSSEHRSIAKINLNNGKLAWLDDEKYEEGIIQWERPLLVKYINILTRELTYFNIKL